MKSIAIKGAAAAAALFFGATVAQADQSDDTLRIAWGVDGVMVNADNYYGATRTGIWFTKMVWDTPIYRDPETGEYKPNLATEWNWIDDTTLELKLREGVTSTTVSPSTPMTSPTPTTRSRILRAV